MATPTIGGNPDPSQIANTTNSLIRDVQGMQDVQVFKDDTGTRRVLMGRGPNGFYGMKVSQEGNDVYDATNDQLVFNSDNNLFKIVSSGTTTITPPDPFAGATPETVTIPHGLGYVPSFLCYVTNPNLSGVADVSTGLTNLPSTVYITNGGSIILVSYASVDSSNIYINLVYLGTASAVGLDTYTWSYKYYLLQETAT